MRVASFVWFMALALLTTNDINGVVGFEEGTKSFPVNEKDLERLGRYGGLPPPGLQKSGVGVGGYTRSLLDEKSNIMFTVEGTETPRSLCKTSHCMKEIERQHSKLANEIKNRHPGAKVISSVKTVANAMFVSIPKEQQHHHQLHKIPGVHRVAPHIIYDVNLEDTAALLQVPEAQQRYCITGKDVTVAILDTGVDYTHQAIGGPGTRAAYEAAYGTDIDSTLNKNRDGLFPTARVIDGYDFLGERFVGDEADASPDDDPIDGQGHGTAVASNILAIAPDAKIVAVKVCATDGGCPQFAIVGGIEYAVDPLGDGSMLGKVDIINLSLGGGLLSAFYDMSATAIENAARAGVLSVVAFGNDGNLPYFPGAIAITPNALSVAAVTHPNLENAGNIEWYSSRGPGENNQLKPDIAAPSGSISAIAGTGTGSRRVFGTSFSAPITSGAVALVKEKCPECTPLALKAILMNNAYREIKEFNTTIPAPLSRMGAGEVRVLNALDADFWAYANDKNNVQPSISLGIINAARDFSIFSTVLVKSISPENNTLVVSFRFRDPADEASGAVLLSTTTNNTVLPACGQVALRISFDIIAANAPPNAQDSSNRNPDDLNRNEFDGFVLLTSMETGKTVAIPFHMVLRQASEIFVFNQTIPRQQTQSKFDIVIENRGAGVAQIDPFQLITTSPDRSEGGQGQEANNADLRAAGYRVIPVNEPGCSHVIEFAINMWERPRHLLPFFASIIIDLNGDGQIDYVIYTTTEPPFDSVYTIVENYQTGEIKCTGFQVDHGIAGGTMVARVCSDDIGLPSVGPTTYFYVGFQLYAFPFLSADVAGYFFVSFPTAAISGNSHDIPGGATLKNFRIVVGPPVVATNYVGLLLVSNSYRTPDSTGAATRNTEAIMLLREGVQEPLEVTADVFLYAPPENITGPLCDWHDVSRNESCSGAASMAPTVTLSSRPSMMDTSFPTRAPIGPGPPRTPNPTPPPRDVECAPANIPRVEVPTTTPSSAPPSEPSAKPSAEPGARPTKSPTVDILIPGNTEAPSPSPVAASSAGTVVSTATAFLSSSSSLLLLCLMI